MQTEMSWAELIERDAARFRRVREVSRWRFLALASLVALAAAVSVLVRQAVGS